MHPSKLHILLGKHPWQPCSFPPHPPQAYLALHSRLEVVPGEIHYFNRISVAEGLDWYLHRMPEVEDGKLLVEKTPGYFITPSAPKQIAQVSGNIVGTPTNPNQYR